MVQEGPQGGFQVQQVLAEGSGLGFGAARTFLQPRLHVAADGVEFILQLPPTEVAAAEGVPGLEEYCNHVEAALADRLRWSAAIDQVLEVAFEVSPADLPTAHRSEERRVGKECRSR